MFGHPHTQVAPPGHAVQSGFQAFVQFLFAGGFDDTLLDQLVVQAPAVQAVQVEVFVIGVVFFHRFKAHLQPALVEGVDGLFQEIRQLVQADGLFGRLVRQRFPALLRVIHGMSAAPFPFIGEQSPGLQHVGQGFGLGLFTLAHAVGSGEIVPAERLQRMLGGQSLGNRTIRLPRHGPQTVQVVL